MDDTAAKIRQYDPIYWKHAAWKAFSGSALVGLGSAPTVILGWDTMLLSGKLVACIGIAISIIKSLDMLFDQTLSRVAAGKLPVKLDGQNGFDTTHITKTEITETKTAQSHETAAPVTARTP